MAAVSSTQHPAPSTQHPAPSTQHPVPSTQYPAPNSQLFAPMPKLHLEAEVQDLRTKHPFIIARGGKSDYRTVVVKLKDGDGLEGWGEAAGITYYGESPETILAALQTYATVLP